MLILIGKEMRILACHPSFHAIRQFSVILMLCSPVVVVGLNIHENFPSGGCHRSWQGGGCTDLCLYQKVPLGCLLKKRSRTDPLMKTHHEADQIVGQCGTPAF